MLSDLPKLLSAEKIDSILLYGKDENIRFLTGFSTPDPVLALFSKNPWLVVGGFEAGRAKKECYRNCKILTFEQLGYFSFYKNFLKKGLKRSEASSLALAETATALVKRAGAKNVGLPKSFPWGLASRLQFKISESTEALSDARETKSGNEIAAIEFSQHSTESIILAGAKVAKPGKNIGKIKGVMRVEAEKLGMDFPEGFIVSTGTKAADPHYQGEPKEKIQQNSPLVLDIYPRSRRGYWGDCTRTLLLGSCSQEIKEAFSAVQRAMEAGYNAVEIGGEAKAVDIAVCEVLENNGYQTMRKNEKAKDGFLHSTGHGIGLYVHESPAISHLSTDILKNGQVFSIEPGLYFPGKFGIRIEDLVAIWKGKLRRLNKLPHILKL
ncbi:MAG: aminopeptidase P family protein [Candidatus Aenigmarchaeota archaeon]|nr:aminopeptidase P family protein [Candidatus Aenigmarchaeota archaeon]